MINYEFKVMYYEVLNHISVAHVGYNKSIIVFLKEENRVLLHNSKTVSVDSSTSII